MTPRSAWILAIVGLLATNVVAMVIIAVAASCGSAQVIPDYYARAAHYDDELARSAASRALGWRVDLTMTPGAIDAAVSDASGKPIGGAEVRITGYQRAHAAESLDVVLSAVTAGRYRGLVRQRRGWYDLIAAVDAGGAHYTQHIVVEAR